MAHDPNFDGGWNEPEVPASTPPVINHDADPARAAGGIDEPGGDTVKQPDGDTVKVPGGDQIEQGENPDEIRQPSPDSIDPPPAQPEIAPPPD